MLRAKMGQKDKLVGYIFRKQTWFDKDSIPGRSLTVVLFCLIFYVHNVFLNFFL